MVFNFITTKVQFTHLAAGNFFPLITWTLSLTILLHRIGTVRKHLDSQNKNSKLITIFKVHFKRSLDILIKNSTQRNICKSNSMQTNTFLTFTQSYSMYTKMKKKNAGRHKHCISPQQTDVNLQLILNTLFRERAIQLQINPNQGQHEHELRYKYLIIKI